MNALSGAPSTTAPASGDSDRLHIHVIFTNLDETRLALRRAERLAAGLEAEIVLILAQVVPFPLPLDEPPTSIDFAQTQVQWLIDGKTVEGCVFFCRDPLRLFSSVLPPKALLVIGTSRRWPFAKSQRLARALRREGHHVVTASP
jgi:hypothetical protein